MNINRNGSVAVRYLTRADDFIDFHIEKYTMTQALIRQAASSHLNIPGSSIPELICSTLLLMDHHEHGRSNHENRKDRERAFINLSRNSFVINKR